MALAAVASMLAGCGGGPRQDADEPEGTYRVELLEARFPLRQHLGERSSLTITVRNTGRDDIPNLTATVAGFTERSAQADLSDPRQPVWVVDESPEGGATAYDDTWTSGPLRAGERRTLRWGATPVVAGTHELRYAIAAGPDGKARAVLAGGRRPRGSITVRVQDEPSEARVDPETGDVIRDDPPNGG